MTKADLYSKLAHNFTITRDTGTANYFKEEAKREEELGAGRLHPVPDKDSLRQTPKEAGPLPEVRGEVQS